MQLAMTPVDCGELCMLGTFFYPLALIVLGMPAFAAVVWLGKRRAVRRETVAAAHGLTGSDAVLAAHDAVLLGLLGLVVGRACGVTARLPFDVGIPSDVVTFGSAWLGSFLLLLGLRVRSARRQHSLWAEIATSLVTAGFFGAGALAIRAKLTGNHPGPCLTMNLEDWPLAACGIVIAALGSFVARASVGE